MKDAYSKKIGHVLVWADHLVKRVVQQESKRRGGLFLPELDRPSRREKIDRRAVLGVNWYVSVQILQLIQSNSIVDVWIIFMHQWAPRQLILLECYIFVPRFGHMVIRVVYGTEFFIPAFPSAHTSPSKIHYTRLVVSLH